ncbi:MAG: ATP synthase F1 subunit gamma [Planctomycetota bacterium]
MLGTRKIKRKIRSVNNIKKITQAMQMVSAAKLKKIQGKLLAIRPYASKLQAIMDNLLTYLPPEAITHPLLKTRLPGSEHRETSGASQKTIVAVIMASDKGLCGSYNNNLLRTAGNFIKENMSSVIKIIALGRKAGDYFKKQSALGGLEILTAHTQLSTDVNFRSVKNIIAPVLRQYESQILDEVWLIYSEFINPMVQKPRVTRFLPLLTPEEIISRQKMGQSEADNQSLTKSAAGQESLPYGYLFEPEPKIILDLVVPRYIEVVFYRIVLESMASEQAARMMAMRNATDNAEEVIEDLTLTFNKARQSGITKELLDIVGGAEAMR